MALFKAAWYVVILRTFILFFLFFILIFVLIFIIIFIIFVSITYWEVLHILEVSLKVNS